MDRERKIMVEVTPQEYNKIVSGALDSSGLSNEDLMLELVRRCANKKMSTVESFYSWSGQLKVITGELRINDNTTIEFSIKSRE